MARVPEGDRTAGRADRPSTNQGAQTLERRLDRRLVLITLGVALLASTLMSLLAVLLVVLLSGRDPVRSTTALQRQLSVALTSSLPLNELRRRVQLTTSAGEADLPTGAGEQPELRPEGHPAHREGSGGLPHRGHPAHPHPHPGGAGAPALSSAALLWLVRRRVLPELIAEAHTDELSGVYNRRAFCEKATDRPRAHALLEAADAALYVAKDRGRNQVEDLSRDLEWQVRVV
ncbi:MAG: hypothetical protein ACKO22_13140 [Cyanobium sp.]